MIGGSVVRVALATALGGIAPVVPVTPVSAAVAPVRVMLVGDSMTEGSSGDWTWRYRLARYLDSSGVDYDFVGPRVTMLNLATNEHDSLEYADPAFDRHHFARWGEGLHAILNENATVPEDSIGWAVSTYQPDVVVEVLGTNDLLYGSPVQETVDVAHQFVSEVRAARPDAAIVLSTAPDVAYPHFQEYDDLLVSTAPQWSTSESPVVVSTPDQGWVGTTDTCDSTHPSAVGEVKIAAAQADALATLGIGAPVERPLPRPAVGPRVPATVAGVPGDGQVVLTWKLPPGGTSVLISTRDVTAGEGWRQLPFPVEGTSWRSDGLTDGHTYQYRLNVLKHECLAADVVSATVTARPGVPLAASGFIVRPRDHGFRATWHRAALATSYRLSWWPAGHPRRVASSITSSLQRRVHGLTPRRLYVVAVQGVHGRFLGPARHLRVMPHG